MTTTLTLTKVANTPTVEPGGSGTFLITLTNTGGADATGVVLTDTLTPIVGLTSYTIIQLTGPAFVITETPPGSGIFTSNAVTLPAGTTATFEVTINVDDTTPPGTVYTNTASASATNAATVTDSDIITVVLPALTVTKTASPNPVVAGQPVTFTISVSNNGATVITDGTVTDVLPPGTTFISASPPASSVVGNTVTFDGTLVFAPLSTTNFTITALVGPGVPPGTTLTNTVTATGLVGGEDPVTATAIATVTVVSSAGLTLTKSGPQCVKQCSPIVYTIEVTNNGPSTITDLTIEEKICGDVKLSCRPLIQVSGPSFVISPSSPLSATIATLAVGETATFRVIVCARKPGVVSNIASATATTALTPTSTITAAICTRVLKKKNSKKDNKKDKDNKHGSKSSSCSSNNKCDHKKKDKCKWQVNPWFF